MNDAEAETYVKHMIIDWLKKLNRMHAGPDIKTLESYFRRINKTVPDWILLKTSRRFLRNSFWANSFRYIIQEDAEAFSRFICTHNDGLSLETVRAIIKSLLRGISHTALRTFNALWKKNKRDCLLVLDRIALGGAERSCLNLANDLVRRGYTVDLYALRGGMSDSYPIDKNIECTQKKQLLRRQYRVAVNYCHWVSPSVVIDLVRADRRIQWIHNDLPRVFGRYPSRKWANYYRRFDSFVCVSHAVRESFVLIYPELETSAKTIFNSYDPSVLGPLAREKPSLILDKDIPCVVSSGRLVEAKGYARAIRAMSLLLAEGWNFRWYVLGEGKERPHLERLVARQGLEGRFLLPGAYKNPFPILARADLFAHLAFYEGFGLSVLEAVELGLPVLATDFGPAREVLAGVSESLIVPNSLEGITDGLRQCLNKIQLAKKPHSTHVKRQYPSAEILDQIVSLFFN